MMSILYFSGTNGIVFTLYGKTTAKCAERERRMVVYDTTKKNPNGQEVGPAFINIVIVVGCCGCLFLVHSCFCQKCCSAASAAIWTMQLEQDPNKNLNRPNRKGKVVFSLDFSLSNEQTMAGKQSKLG